MQALPYNVFKSFHIISQGNFCTKGTNSNDLKKLYVRTFNFKDILVQNDSFEDFTDLIEM